MDVIGEPLIHIVMAGCIAVDRLLHNSLHTAHKLLISESLVETTGKCLPVVFMEAFHVLAVGHHLHPLHYLPLVVSYKLQCEEEKVLEVEEYVRLGALHQLEVVFGQFEGSLLESKIAGRTAEDEAKINVDNMAVVINQDIIVVPVLDLEKILHH